MKHEDLFPPAQVREYEEGATAIAKHAGALCAEIRRNDKTNVQKALEAGRLLLRLRPMCSIGDWEPMLEGNGISQQRASDFMWGAEQPEDVRTRWDSIADLRNCRQAHNGPGQEGLPRKGQTLPTESVKPGPWPGDNRCRACRVADQNDPYCKRCKEMNTPPPEELAEEVEAGLDPHKVLPEIMPRRRGRQPGEDDGDIDARDRPTEPKTTKGRVALAFVSVVDEINALAHAKGEKGSVVVNDLRRRAEGLQRDIILAYRAV